MAPLPTILLLPGAFTTPACYNNLAPLLQKSNYPITIASLITTNPSSPSTCSASLEGQNLLENYLLPLIDQEKDVLIFAHSFGATSLSGAGKGLTRQERRKKGLKGGVIGFVGFSFAFCQDDISQLSFLGNSWPPFCKLNIPHPGLIVFSPAADLLYNDIPPPLQNELAAGHLPQAMTSFTTPVKEPLWTDPALDGRRLYLRSLKDQTFPPEAQKAFVEGCGREWEVKEVDGGHCAFISKAEEMARILIEAAERWI